MKWRCASCGWAAKTNRKKCPKCGSSAWKPAPKTELNDLSGPLKRIAPRGLLLANPGKQAPDQKPGEIECGICHAVIYGTNKDFDANALEEAIKKHYSVSPACKGDK